MTKYNLASERVRLGLTQEQLGKQLGYGVKTISKWERDVSAMPGSVLKTAAGMFGCTIDYLLDRTDERTGAN